MKKKISLLLCALMTLLCLSGCSAEATNKNIDTTMMQQVAEAMIVGFSGMEDTDFEQFDKMSDFRLDYTMMQSNLPISAEDFRYMMKSWTAAVEENGKYLSHGEYKTKMKSSGVVLTTEVRFEDATADIVFTFDADENLISMDVSGQMQTSVIFRRAGLNTILGMGIVFIVLIMLAFIIYLMKFIPRLMNGDKDNNAVHKVTVVQYEQDTSNDKSTNLTDDLELVAVITAAIAAQEGKSADGFVVRSIRRRPSNHWS